MYSITILIIIESKKIEQYLTERQTTILRVNFLYSFCCHTVSYRTMGSDTVTFSYHRIYLYRTVQ